MELERQHKKLRVADVEHAEDAVSNRETQRNPATGGLNIAEIPQDDLMDIFTYCHLPLRCKLRRVCRYWKHLVSRLEVNETVIVNYSCLFVRSTKSKCAKLQEGGYDGKDRKGNPNDMTDHLRQGLMGPHVRTIIYAASQEDASIIGRLPDILRSIGYHCTGVRHIVLWRVQWNVVKRPPRKALFCAKAPSGLPQPQCLTVVAFRCRLGCVDNDSFYTYKSKGVPWGLYFTAVYQLCGEANVALCVVVPVWRDDDQSDEEFVKQFYPACPVGLRSWVAKYERHLPHEYHYVIDRFDHIYSGFKRPEKKYCDEQDSVLVLAMAQCILREKVNLTPPPSSFRAA